MVSVIFYISHLWFYDVKMLLQKRKVCASPPRLDNILLKDWCKSLWVTISHCLPITSAEIDLIRCPILESRMNPPGVVKIHIMLHSEAELRSADVLFDFVSSYFNAHQKRSIFALSKQRPRPSMLIRIPWAWSSATNFELVNWLPWSELKISILDSDALSCICTEDTGISHVPDEVPRYWNADVGRPSADSSISAVCAPVYGLLCIRGVSIPQSNGELRKMASPYKSPAFRPWPARRKLSGKSPAGFCNKSSNEAPEAASTDDSRLNPDSDRLFELFWIQAAGQGHTS